MTRARAHTNAALIRIDQGVRTYTRTYTRMDGDDDD